VKTKYVYKLRTFETFLNESVSEVQYKVPWTTVDVRNMVRKKVWITGNQCLCQWCRCLSHLRYKFLSR
jgi:hypothetical protein